MFLFVIFLYGRRCFKSKTVRDGTVDHLRALNWTGHYWLHRFSYFSSDEDVWLQTDNKTSSLSSVRWDAEQLTCRPPSRGRKCFSEETCCCVRHHLTGSLQAFHTICQVRIKQLGALHTWGFLSPSSFSHRTWQKKTCGSCHCQFLSLFFFSSR